MAFWAQASLCKPKGACWLHSLAQTKITPILRNGPGAVGPASGHPTHAHKEANLPCASLMQLTWLIFISRVMGGGHHVEKKPSTSWVMLDCEDSTYCHWMHSTGCKKGHELKMHVTSSYTTWQPILASSLLLASHRLLFQNMLWVAVGTPVFIFLVSFSLPLPSFLPLPLVYFKWFSGVLIHSHSLPPWPQCWTHDLDSANYGTFWPFPYWLIKEISMWHKQD